MKKVFILSLLAILLSCVPAYAYSRVVSEPLRNLTTGNIIAVEIGQLDTGYLTTSCVMYTKPIAIQKAIMEKDMALVVDLTGGDVDISWQFSEDGKTFYLPDATASGLTMVGTVTACTADTMYLLDAIPAKFIRFFFDADADTGISGAQLMYAEDK